LFEKGREKRGRSVNIMEGKNFFKVHCMKCMELLQRNYLIILMYINSKDNETI
jgi:hypothetical protein